MPTEIVIHITGLDTDGAIAAALYDAELGDILVSQDRHGGNGSIEADIENLTFDTLTDLRNRIEAVGVSVTGFSPPALVNTADIAARIGRTPQSVTMLIAGDRGPGNFPAAINPGARSEYFNWCDVADWLTAHSIADVTTESINTAAVITAANESLHAAT